MAKNKTEETTTSVTDFINAVENETKRKNSLRLMELMKAQTGFEPKMWGTSIVGFGSYHYKYSSGHEGNAPLTGFSPRKDAITLYLTQEYEGKEELLRKLGKHKAAKACIYIKKMDDVNENVLKEIIDASIERLKELYSS